MAKEKLIPPNENPDDERQPHERFTDLASKVMKVTKKEIEDRERDWERRKGPQV